jgi:FtsH-binding integral membrane protein
MGNAARIAIGGASGLALVGLGMAGHLYMEDTQASKADSFAMANPRALWPDYVRERVNRTFLATLTGTTIAAGSAAAFWLTGGAAAVARMNPWMYMLVFGGGAIGSHMWLRAAEPESLSKYAAFTAFHALSGLSLAPLGALGGPLVLRAAGYTAGIVGSLSWVAANSPSEQFLWLGGPLAIGLGVVLVSSIGTMLFPAARAAPMLHNVSMYGGLGLFSLFCLYDTSVIVKSAEVAPEGMYDHLSHGVRLYLDAVNIFVRLAMIMSGSGRKK